MRKTKVLWLIMALVLFFTFVIYFVYAKSYKNKIDVMASSIIEDCMTSFLSNNISYDLLKDQNFDKMLNIHLNNEKEILYADYNLKEAYKILDTVTSKLNELIVNLENGQVNVNNKNVFVNDQMLVLVLPMGISSSNTLLANLGPKIYIPINFVGSLLTNIKTNITNYGMNNALVEMYITVKIVTNIIGPFSSKTKEIEYDCLISSNVINGRVPEFYGSVLETKSNSLAIPLE